MSTGEFTTRETAWCPGCGNFGILKTLQGVLTDMGKKPREVLLVAGPVPLPTPPGVDRIDVESAQEMAAAAKQFQLPSNKNTKVDPNVPDFKKIKFINYDYAKYGASDERKRLIAKWEKEVNSLPR